MEEEEVQLMENASKEEPSIPNETNKKKSSSKMTSTFKRAFGKKKSRQTRLCLSLIRASRTKLRQRLILIKWRERNWRELGFDSAVWSGGRPIAQWVCCGSHACSG